MKVRKMVTVSWDEVREAVAAYVELTCGVRVVRSEFLRKGTDDSVAFSVPVGAREPDLPTDLECEELCRGS